MSNELTDVRCPCGAEFQADSYDAGFIAGSGMCQNCDAALPPKDICTCPSGDGSLSHPCPAHPAVEQAGGDRWDALQSIMEWTAAENIPDDRKLCLIRNAARAALAQPSGEVVVTKNESGAIVSVTRQDKEGRVLSVIAESATLTAQAEQAEAERPEVVAYADPVAFATFKERGHEGGVAGREWMWAEPGAALVAMSRTDECERIVGALREQYECNTAIMHARTEALSRVTSERDAALSRVAELEKQEPVATVAKVPGEDWNSLDFHRDLQDMQPGTKLYAAPLAQAQQLHDLDKQCRDDVARALGLRPNKERGFAWSYLLASIKSCVKASGDSAQAQHSVPEGWKLVPVEPTEDVLEAIHNGGYVGDDQELRWFYQSILAAAPAPGGE
ncbi:TPA: hypothetical protein ACGJU5_006057 [Pseudomonas aeruginosa]|uniref:hypothetical protein n=1 Tax=Pseudomonas aeruginosa TaxID=287 RepID=UPI00068C011A|nr:hypothetical protein [Pseudomonas aeruginosa]MCC9291214.1 hypothetical protein [Pseudomonas aeruginosa]